MENNNEYTPAPLDDKELKQGEYQNQSSSETISSNQVGLLGKLFGQGINAKTNIVGVATIILVMTISIGWGVGGNEPPSSLTIALSTLIGYFIADKKSDG